MKKTAIALTFLCSLFATIKQEAALPPLYQSIEEIKAILSHEDLKKLQLGGELVLGIQKAEEGYLLETSGHLVLAEVHYLHTSKVGPIAFEIHFQPPIQK